MIQRSEFKDVAETAPIPETDRFSKEYWTIGQMAGHFDVSLRTLRFYEDRGLISPLRHGATRFYGAECRRTLERVLRAKKLGFTLARIQRLLLNNAEAGIAESLAPGEIAAQLSVLERQKANLDQAIMDLRAAHAHVGGEGQLMARAG
ncbi:MAG: MerR family transcriptional regulator [Beijerinckiaceae bacterium]|nr:MerR family transcriptional regulator [Beijerinckiaceae bacterium]